MLSYLKLTFADGLVWEFEIPRAHRKTAKEFTARSAGPWPEAGGAAAQARTVGQVDRRRVEGGARPRLLRGGDPLFELLGRQPPGHQVSAELVDGEVAVGVGDELVGRVHRQDQLGRLAVTIVAAEAAAEPWMVPSSSRCLSASTLRLRALRRTSR